MDNQEEAPEAKGSLIRVPEGEARSSAGREVNNEDPSSSRVNNRAGFSRQVDFRVPPNQLP